MMTRISLAALTAAMLALGACSSKTGDGGTGTGATDATVNDTKTGTDDVATGGDTGGGSDTGGGKDAGKDTTKTDTGPAAPTWGACALDDTACLQSCVPSSCGDQIAACQADKGCAAFDTCIQGCLATPIKMPEQVTPVAALPSENTATADGKKAYCERVCEIQAPGASLAIDQSVVECEFGLCIDCASVTGSTSTYCKSACGAENFCATEAATCAGDMDCLDAYGCILKCDSSDTACQNGCVTNAKGNGGKEFSAFNTCFGKNNKKCVAP